HVTDDPAPQHTLDRFEREPHLRFPTDPTLVRRPRRLPADDVAALIAVLPVAPPVTFERIVATPACGRPQPFPFPWCRTEPDTELAGRQRRQRRPPLETLRLHRAAFTDT